MEITPVPALMAPPPAAQQEKPRIIALDDSNDILELIMASLQDTNDVIALNNAVDLYEIMDLFEPDLLILDIMMPRVTGYQLIEMIRKSPGKKEIPIIVLSAKSTAGEIKHGYKLGANMYITKPFAPDRLAKNVETQFRVHPNSRRKSHTLEQVAQQLQSKAAFNKGNVLVSPSIHHRESVVDARKLMQERLLKEQKATDRNWAN